MEIAIISAIAILIVLIFFRDRMTSEWTAFRTDSKSWFKKMWKEWGEPFLIAALIAIIIRTFLVGPYKIPTGSMRPTLLEGDRIFVDKVTYRFRPPQRGEIVVFKYPLDPKKDFVKRLVAFGGEEVEIKDGMVWINGKQLREPAQFRSYYYYNRNDWPFAQEGQVFKVPADSYFVLGDNSAQSSDSRNWGFVPKKYMVGKAFLIWWPVYRIGIAD